MANPTADAVRTPAGIPLEDGYQTTLVIGVDTDIKFEEKSVTPPGWEGGDPVDTTTMYNSSVRTKAPRALKELTPATAIVAYDPGVITEILAVINVHSGITVIHPDGTTWAFWGYLRSFIPSESVEGTQPEATITIEPTNWDPGANVEATLGLTDVSGT